MRKALKIIFITVTVFLMLLITSIMQATNMGGALPTMIVIGGGMAAIRAIYRYGSNNKNIQNQEDNYRLDKRS